MVNIMNNYDRHITLLSYKTTDTNANVLGKLKSLGFGPFNIHK